jgi:Karyopherin (importin) alpha
MNKRRLELSSKLRKEKKSHQLQVKRRLTGSQMADQSASNAAAGIPMECLQNLLDSPSMMTLSALQTSLATSKQTSSLPLSEIPTQQADNFLQQMVTFLAAAGDNIEACILSLQILTNLAAMECPESYYSNCGSWCKFMLSRNLTPTLVALVSSTSSQVQEQSCWVIGNIAGDSQQCRMLLISENVIGALTIALSQNEGNLSLRRNVAWTLCNIARGIETAMPFVQGGMTAKEILYALSLERSTNVQSQVTLWDFRKEMYWLVSFLTSKEDEEKIFETLMNDELLLVLSQHFAHVSQVTLDKRDRGSIFQSVIPLMRIFGNLATAVDGKYVKGVIEVDNHSIVDTLALWLKVHKPCGETMTIATEATWVAGALLCDYGYANHPSTTTACPVLIPPLCRVLLKGTFTLEWKREVLNAIWNALAAPPGSNAEDTIIQRDALLLEIYREKGMVRALVGMLVCLDVDAIRPAINMLDAMHRRVGRYDGNASTFLKEAECEHALERVCEAASSNASYGGSSDWQHSEGGMDYCADMAANLIDDFYGEEHDEEFDVGAVATSQSGSFEFGPLGPPPTFDFTNSQDSAQNSVVSDPMSSPAGRGMARGRGRGRSLPAWMNQRS